MEQGGVSNHPAQAGRGRRSRAVRGTLVRSTIAARMAHIVKPAGGTGDPREMAGGPWPPERRQVRTWKRTAASRVTHDQAKRRECSIGLPTPAP